ncbi:hypothetical protein EV401DRAFT_1891512 [Pisolithus croceorrhizus]|nr:hypothetical protein EV401DRAFT_1891512 [Pisolithus croceorrhizus]
MSHQIENRPAVGSAVRRVRVTAKYSHDAEPLTPHRTLTGLVIVEAGPSSVLPNVPKALAKQLVLMFACVERKEGHLGQDIRRVECRGTTYTITPSHLAQGNKDRLDERKCTTCIKKTTLRDKFRIFLMGRPKKPQESQPGTVGRRENVWEEPMEVPEEPIPHEVLELLIPHPPEAAKTSLRESFCPFVMFCTLEVALDSGPRGRNEPFTSLNIA